jgi:hypothetical protein
MVAPVTLMDLGVMEHEYGPVVHPQRTTLPELAGGI